MLIALLILVSILTLIGLVSIVKYLYGLRKSWKAYVSDEKNVDKCNVCNYKKIRDLILKPFFGPILNFFKNIPLFLWRHIGFISFVVLCIVATASISLVVAHIIRVFGKTPYGAIEFIPDFVLQLFGSTVEALIEQKHYAIILADMIAICAFGFAVLPIIQGSYFKREYARRFKKEQGMETSEVKKKGGDIATMLRYYKGADHITIFCGSFDWVYTYPKMQSFIKRFASDGDKLKLISYRSKTAVSDAFEALGEGGTAFFELLMEKNCFIFGNGLTDVKCSLIKRVGTETRFLFMQHSDTAPFNTCVLSSTDQSRALLHILRELTDPIHWDKEAK